MVIKPEEKKKKKKENSEQRSNSDCDRLSQSRIILRMLLTQCFLLSVALLTIFLLCAQVSLRDNEPSIGD